MLNDSCYIVAEIGINHNGDLNAAKELIAVAKEAGCDAVKFQKRTVDTVYSVDELRKPRKSPFGNTNGDLKHGLEFGRDEYDEIDRYCQALNINWFAAPWDRQSVDFLLDYNIPFLKVASPMATDTGFLEYCAQTSLPLIVSTGICDLPMIRKIVDVIESANGRIASLYHCVSTYPAEIEDLNLNGIKTLAKEFPHLAIGYSGHETVISTSVMAAVLGANSIERHITLSRENWGSDQAASLEPDELRRLVQEVRTWEKARGDGVIRILEGERPIEQKLRRTNTLNIHE